MNLYLLVHRWFASGEGWAYADALPDAIRRRAVGAVSEWMGDEVGEERSLCDNAMTIWGRCLRDDKCLDPLAKNRNPRIYAVVVCVPPSSPTPVMMREAEALFAYATSITSPGSAAGLARALSRTDAPDIGVQKNGGRNRLRTACLVAVVAAALGTIGYLFSGPASDPSTSCTPTLAKAAASPDSERAKSDDTISPLRTRQQRSGMDDIAAALRRELETKRGGESMRELRDTTNPDAVVNFFFSLHSRHGLMDAFGVDSGQSLSAVDAEFLLRLPENVPVPPSNADECISLLVELAKTTKSTSLPQEEVVDNLLAAIRDRLGYRAWVIEQIEGKEWDVEPIISTDVTMMRVMRVFSPAPGPGYKTEETNTLLDLIKEEKLLDYLPPPTDNILPALRSLEEAERWRIYALFFSLVNRISHTKRLRPAGDAPIAVNKIIRFAEMDATLAGSGDDMLMGEILEIVADDPGKYKSRLGMRGKP